MMNILEELFFGNIAPNIEQIESPDYQALMQTVECSEESLLKLLEGDSSCLFMEYAHANEELNAITAIHKFSVGFRLGALLMADIFTSADNGVYR